MLTAIAALQHSDGTAGHNMNVGDVNVSGGWGIFRDPDHSERDENRMKLTAEELSHLETLQGREKKAYVKFLREKYKK